MPRLLPLLFLALLGFTALAQEPAKRDPLKLTYLANEGFLVEVGDERVLLDGFLAMPYAGYPALPKEALAKLRKAEAPFAGIDLAVTSHVHGDHFQPSVAKDFLLASEGTPLATTPQVVSQLRETEGWPAGESHRLLGKHPKEGETESAKFGAIEVQLLRIPHGGMPDVQNLGSLVRVGGHTLLHLGDADTDPKVFACYRKELKQVDLVLAPVWFYATKAGKGILKEYLPAKAKVAMHFASRDHAKVVTSFLENHPGVVAFPKPLDSHSFE